MSYFEFLMVLIGLVGAIAVSEMLVFWGHAIRNWGSIRSPGLLATASGWMMFNVITHVTGIWAYREVEFDPLRIERALLKAGQATGEFEEAEARLLTGQVLKVIDHRYSHSRVPDIEAVQDIVEQALCNHGREGPGEAVVAAFQAPFLARPLE